MPLSAVLRLHNGHKKEGENMTGRYNNKAEIFDELLERYPQLEVCKQQIKEAFGILNVCFGGGGSLYIAGNGGSAAASDHMCAELIKSFRIKRQTDTATASRLKLLYGEEGEKLSQKLEGGLSAFSLPSLVSASTAFANDVGYEAVFAQFINSAAKKGDCFFAISTSGESGNIVLAAMTAKAKGIKVIGLAGQRPCRLDSLCDTVIHVPETETFKIQELHLPVYHALCAMLEAEFFTGTGE